MVGAGNTSLGRLSTHNYLSSILDIARTNIMVNEANGQDEADALILEDFLNLVALGQPTDNIILGYSMQNRKEVIESFGIPLKQLINQDVSGLAFEDWAQSIFEQALEKAKEQQMISYGSKVSISGTDSFLLFEDVVDPMMQDLYAQTYRQASQTVKDKTKEVNRYNIKADVYGKIDTANYYSDFQVHIHDEYLEKLLPLLASASFTDKAYLTKHDVRIGQTNPFRVFVAMSPDTGQAKLDRWYRTMTCMNENGPHGSHNAPLLFYELRYIYELTGYGGYYVREEIRNLFKNGARFFLYYSNQTLIKVIPVSRIIKNLNAKLSSGKLIKQKNIDKEYALYAKLKMRLTATDPMTFELE